MCKQFCCCRTDLGEVLEDRKRFHDHDRAADEQAGGHIYDVLDSEHIHNETKPENTDHRFRDLNEKKEHLDNHANDNHKNETNLMQQPFEHLSTCEFLFDRAHDDAEEVVDDDHRAGQNNGRPGNTSYY